MYMTSAAAAVIVVIKRRRRREQHQRDAWSRQWLLNRTSERGIANFVDYELRDDTLGFHSFLRMGSSEFNEILNEIAGDIMRMDMLMRDSVTPKERLVVTLRYLASGKPHSICKQESSANADKPRDAFRGQSSHQTWYHLIC